MKKSRNFKESSKLYHHYLNRSGGYKFIGINLLKLLGILTVFAVSVWFANTYIFDFDAIMEKLLTHFPDWIIVTSLFLSESFIGILPPDFYILWGKAHPWGNVMILILAAASYLGGLISYSYGRLLYRVPKIHFLVVEKFKDQFALIKKYGGLLIVISTLTPLPYSPLSVVAGIIKFPFKWFVALTLMRFARFFIYAYVLEFFV